MRAITAMVLLLVLAVGCASNDESVQDESGEVSLTGIVTEIGGHGNAYTNLDNAALGTVGIGIGDRILVSFPDTPVILTVGTNYDDVPDGENVAVLHREGSVVFAIFNGDFHGAYGVTPGTEFTITPAPVE
ncbi:MAG TPA: hypothetical protein ENN56_02795 [Firmicutes bacterium]|nr:hypothetical protein [Bacillota bacterium]